jgi:aminopeptidase
MSDPRIEKFARLLAHYSIKAKPRETVGVETTSEAEPLVEPLYAELLKAGAFPVIRMTPSSLAETLYREGQPHHLDEAAPFELAYANNVDSTIRIMASPNTRDLANFPPSIAQRLAKSRKPVREILLKKKWSLTLFPTQAYAMDAEMSLRDFEDFVYSANFLDRKDPVAEWDKLEKKHQKLIARLRKADQVRIVGPDTDLKMSVKKRTFLSSVATANVPSGEVFTGPIENSAEGYIKYDFPVCNGGREIDGIRLEFRAGKVVGATATKNQDYLLAMLDMDPGARYLGELGIGTNYGIQRFIKNILFDEKIGGTIHLAVGESYEETGGVNKSALHWDMIKDLRTDGAIYLDGELFQKNGKFVDF